jgi:hypothetical protein
MVRATADSHHPPRDNTVATHRGEQELYLD